MPHHLLFVVVEKKKTTNGNRRENKREADLKAVGQLPNRPKPKPCLAPDRKKLLDELGFQWRVAGEILS